MEKILEVKNLTKRFGDFTAVNSISFTIEKGEIYGIVGPNGAGKTTTIKMLTTLLPPTSGEAFIAGYNVAKSPAKVRRIIGYVPQLVSADGNLTGYENLLIFAKLYDLPPGEREKRIRDSIQFMDLSESADKLVKQYSGGMIRRLEIAQAVLHNPLVIFLDEPTVGLDPIARESVWEYVKILSGRGTTILMTTHYMEEADRMCNHLTILNKGGIAAFGSPAGLKESIGNTNASLNEVYDFYVGKSAESEELGGNFRDVSRTRRTAKRLG
ncbi:MAG TPA: ATP-binding cassette domain-containing protein [Ignavibacteriaceae bacterium]|nr:ATP-binding cassette domain-containing protein [Ignavibacteriaceae bacterium]